MENEKHFIMAHKIMNREEFKKLNDSRISFYNNIAGGVVTKEELMRQIKFELRLLNSCRFKIDQLKKENKNNEFDPEILVTFSNRLNDIYIILFNTFKFDEFMIADYIKFSLQNKYLVTKCIHVLDELMSQYHNSPEVYIRCAHYAFKECDDITTTRRFLSNAIKFHTKCQKLYAEEFWIEVQYMDKMGGTSALDKYYYYIKLFKDNMNFHFSLVDKILKFTSVTELHCIVVSDMVKKYSHSKFMWQNLAKIHLKGFAYNYESQSIYYCQDDLQCISNFFGTYEKALEENVLDIDEKQYLWELFLDEMMKINNSHRVNNSIIRDFVNNKIEHTFYRAYIERTIRKADYFIFWANHSKDNEVMILKKSIEALPENIELWKKLLSHFVLQDNSVAIMETLNNAVDTLQNKSLPLWELVELYMMNADDCDIEEFYQRSAIIEPYTNINKLFRQKYLEWRTLRFGIKSGRVIFNRLRHLKPISLDFYRQMIMYESDFNYIKDEELQLVRNLYSKACTKFGKRSIEIWAECMRFEYNNGYSQLANIIYGVSGEFLEPKLHRILGNIKRELDIEFRVDEIIEIDDDDD